MIGEADERVLDLHDQLARRREDQRARVRLARRVAERRLLAEQLLQDRQREGEGLAGAGLRAGDDVAAVERARDDGALDRPRALVSEIAQALHQLRVQRQRRERDRRRVGVNGLPRNVGRQDVGLDRVRRV